MTDASLPHSSEESSLDSSEVAERRIGDVIAGKWRLERVLGIGGMAVVYAATHTNNLRTVALKLLHPELAANADLRRRFLREGYIANKVGHPGAVAILDDGVDDGAVFLVMELLNGESLAARRDRAPESMTAVEALGIVDKMLDVLAAAHAEGIVHRDLKPDNVFLLEDGSVKVLDFGIARLLDLPGGEQATQTGVMLGTPQYMPPEQARGRVKLVDGRSDLFSVGAIVFTLLTGRHVHQGETTNEALLRAMTTPAPPLASALPSVSPSVAAVIDRALAFEPADRWQDARAMQVAVRGALAELASAPEAPMSSAGPRSASRPVVAVTRAPTPVVQDVSGGGSNGGRVALVIVALCGAAAGMSWVVRSSPFAHVSVGRAAGAPAPVPPLPVLPLPALETADAANPVDADGASALRAAPSTPGESDARAPSASEAPPDAGADAADDLDDASADAESDDEDDDGGDEDEVLPPARGGTTLVKQATHPAHRGVAPAHKRHRKKRKHR